LLEEEEDCRRWSSFSKTGLYDPTTRDRNPNPEKEAASMIPRYAIDWFHLNC
jgi:hypothetical protein